MKADTSLTSQASFAWVSGSHWLVLVVKCGRTNSTDYDTPLPERRRTVSMLFFQVTQFLAPCSLLKALNANLVQIGYGRASCDV